MGFSEAVAAVLGKYAVFQGRARRAEYWWFLLFSVGSNFVASTLDTFTGLPVFGVVVSLALLVPSLAAAVRRLHDTNLTGWLMVAPVIGSVLGSGLMVQGQTGLGAFVVLGTFAAMAVVLARPGTVGPNRFGDDPKATTQPWGTAARNSGS